MNCDCINKIDDKLREVNQRITGYAYIMPEFALTPLIATEWVDKDKAPRGKKRNPPGCFASHCPFCGKPVAKKEKKS